MSKNDVYWVWEKYQKYKTNTVCNDDTYTVLVMISSLCFDNIITMSRFVRLWCDIIENQWNPCFGYDDSPIHYSRCLSQLQPSPCSVCIDYANSLLYNVRSVNPMRQQLPLKQSRIASLCVWKRQAFDQTAYIVVDTGYASIHHSKYWMPIYYETTEDVQNKKSHLLFSK